MISEAEKILCQKLQEHGDKKRAAVESGIAEPGIDPVSQVNTILARPEVESYMDALSLGISAELLEVKPASEYVMPSPAQQQKQMSLEIENLETPQDELKWIKKKALATGDYGTVMKCVEALRKMGAEESGANDTTRDDVKRMDAEEIKAFVAEYAPIVRAMRGMDAGAIDTNITQH